MTFGENLRQRVRRADLRTIASDEDRFKKAALSEIGDDETAEQLLGVELVREIAQATPSQLVVWISHVDELFKMIEPQRDYVTSDRFKAIMLVAYATVCQTLDDLFTKVQR